MFDLEFLVEFVAEQGFQVHRRTETVVVVDIGCGFLLCFENWPEEDDTGIFLEGSTGGWHSHGSLFADDPGDLGLVPVSVLQQLLDGHLLVARTDFASGLVEIALEGAGASNASSLEPGDRLSFYRISSGPTHLGD